LPRQWQIPDPNAQQEQDAGAANAAEALPLQDRFGEQFGHALWVRVCQLDNLMAATCA
jgi:hypothetical protein